MTRDRKEDRFRKSFFLIILVAVLVLLVLLLFLRENLAGMVRALAAADYGLVVLAFVVYLCCIFLWSARWRVSLSAAGHPVPVHHLYLVVLGGIFINNITPFTYAGGDPIARTFLLKKTAKVPYSRGFATIISETILDLPIFLFLLVFGLFSSFYPMPASVMLVVFIMWVLTTIFVLFLISRSLRRRVAAKRVGGLLVGLLSRFRRGGGRGSVGSDVRKFYSGAYSIIGKLRVASSVIAISAFIWVLSLLRLVVIFHALGYPQPSFPMLMVALTVPAIVGLLPLLPAGLGTVDVTVFSIFLMSGIPKSIAMSAVLIDRSITLVFGTLIGAGALSRLGIKMWKGANTEGGG